MLNTSFPRNRWFFLQIVTIIDITSNVSSNSKEPSKYPKVFMTDPSNWRSCKLLFVNLAFQWVPRIFLLYALPHCRIHFHIQIEFLILIFSIMSFFFCSIFLHSCFCIYWKDFHIGFVFFNSFNVFFLCIQFENVFFYAICTSFPKCWAFFLFISCSRPQYEHFFLLFYHVSIDAYLFAGLTL